MTQTVKPGTIIRIKNNTDLMKVILGKQLVTVECPQRHAENGWFSDKVWISVDGNEYWLTSDLFDIVSGPNVCENNSVDVSLDRQRDDNLRRVFG